MAPHWGTMGPRLFVAMHVPKGAGQLRAWIVCQCLLICQPLWHSFDFHQYLKNRGLQRVTDCIH